MAERRGRVWWSPLPLTLIGVLCACPRPPANPRPRPQLGLPASLTDTTPPPPRLRDDGGAPRVIEAPAPSIDWQKNAVAYRGKLGEQYRFHCPAGGVARTVWGSGPYTDDSSICTAAVHAGFISMRRGGTLTIEIAPGLPSYASSTNHGVATRSYRAWRGSFVVIAGRPGPPVRPGLAGPPTLTWAASAVSYRGRVGQRLTFACPPGGRAHTVWGSGPYTDDSSICTAAVHAGRIAFTTGGVVTIRILPGRASYAGTPQNGVTTTAYGAWRGSFEFP